MHASFYFKNFILGSLAVLLSFLFLGAAFLAVGQQVTTREREEALSNNSMETARLASAYALSGDLSDWGLRMVISSIARSSDTHCFLTDAGGTVISCSDMDLRCPHIGRTVSLAFLTDTGEGGYRYGLGTLDGFSPTAAMSPSGPSPARRASRSATCSSPPVPTASPICGTASSPPFSSRRRRFCS